MGLAAGINFSLRSVALAAESYRRDNVEIPLRPDEILQMFGRAGRRGIDEIGYVLVNGDGVRLREGYPAHLARSGLVDWSALLGIMAGAAERGLDPFSEAVKVQQRLFTTKPIFLGVEESLKHPNTPCGLKTDSERARHVRQRVREMLNSRGEWEKTPAPQEKLARDVFVMDRLPEGALELLKLRNLRLRPSEPLGIPGEPHPAAPSDVESQPSPEISSHTELPLALTLHPALSVPEAVEKIGHGVLEPIGKENDRTIYGRAFTVAEILNDGRVLLAKWIRRLTNWNGRQATLAQWQEKIAPLIEKRLALQHTPVVKLDQQEQKIVALVSIAELPLRVPVDAHGVALWRPVEREVFPDDCAVCELVATCRKLGAGSGTASLWRRLGLIDAAGVPTRRGRIVSFFHQEDGLAIGAALEDTSFPLDEFIYELANMDASYRFCGEENRWAGRIPIACHALYGMQSIPGYLENGVPPRYGSGAEQIVAGIHKNPASKGAWVNQFLGTGDIDRVIIEWRSLLRQISKAPPLDWPRWTALQAMARGILNETESPTLIELPPLDYSQTKRIEHQLTFRRH
jgi:hypothetical protein